MSKKPLFSIVVIVKNEAKTLPRLLHSLNDFLKRGGECCVLDTGSSDGTEKIAANLGCKVREMGEKYISPIDSYVAEAINEKFIVEDELPIVKKGDKFFDYSWARNEAASMASNNFIFCYDADEINVQLDIDVINKHIEDGVQQFEYQFVFAKDQWGNEAVKFIQSKAYDRREMEWKGIIHEILSPKEGSSPVRMFLGEDVYKLEHHQNHETNRHTYLKGLALDCYNNPDADRQSHYFARELHWNGRNKSAIKEFKRHIEMQKWPAERAQSCIFIGDCYGKLNNPIQQVGWYNRAFYIDSSRREALIKTALFYRHNNNPQAAACFATAAMEIPYTGFYASNMADYTFIPHEILYWAYGWLGRIDKAQEHILKALTYQPFNPRYLEDTKYYFEYKFSNIDGWMSFKELLFLYELGKKYDKVGELGSWKGRSSHALASGCKGQVYCIDTWEGSDDVRDSTYWLSKEENIYEIFKENTKQFSNIESIRGRGADIVKEFEDGELDMFFIDAAHDFDSVVSDIRDWLPKVRKGGVLCGHDYMPDTWQQVIEAVNQELGIPTEIHDTIWVYHVK